MHEILVDKEDKWIVDRWKWRVLKNGHVGRMMRKSGKIECVYLARLIMGFPKGKVVDHINGNILDNRKSNLRIVTQQQNVWNQGMRSNNTSGYKGVFWNKMTRSWRATITVNYKQIHLGLFHDIREASLAYETAADKYFGEYKRKA